MPTLPGIATAFKGIASYFEPDTMHFIEIIICHVFHDYKPCLYMYKAKY